MTMEYKAILLKKRPTGDFTPDCFETTTLTTPQLSDGQFLVKQTHMSLDPAMRTWVQDNPDSYLPPVGIGEVMRAFGVGVVVESKNADFPVGSQVYGMTGWTEYCLGGEDMQLVPEGVSVEALMCCFNVPGLTAYAALKKTKPKAGETLVVTGASGSVGSIVGQIAKYQGLRVIGIGGPQEEKIKWMEEELGFDKAINYTSPTLKEEIDAALPDGANIFVELTGGPAQHYVFEKMARYGRIEVIGVMADYNKEVPALGPSWVQVNLKVLNIDGFIITDHYDEMQECFDYLAEMIKNGKLHYQSHYIEGLDSAFKGVHMLFTGQNLGKLIVKL
jgi:NADPH-dependent curcumin reductase CurA